jgi:hypothetical protein
LDAAVIWQVPHCEKTIAWGQHAMDYYSGFIDQLSNKFSELPLPNATTHNRISGIQQPQGSERLVDCLAELFTV